MTAQIDFESLLKEAIGLDSASVGSASIESAVRSRMTVLGINQIDKYHDNLRQSAEELQELIEAVVVPETWFFRDCEAFAVLARLVANDWLPNHPNQALRLLSGACCTGEEPYSMVMAVLDAGLPRERLQVDAVDVSLRALNRARRGLYGQNSFRGEELSFRDRYFEKVEGGYRAAGLLREIVSFHAGNLRSPNFGMEVPPYDVIFCRNVLIYFDHQTQQRVLKRLADLLTPTGVLFVGPAEAFLAASSGFTSVNRSMSFAFRKSTAVPKAPAAVFRMKPSKKVKIPRKVLPLSKGAPHLPAMPEPSLSPPPLDRLEHAKKLADAGRLAEAGELCEMHLKHNGSSFEAYYLLALVRDSMGDAAIAAQCYRKALYLEPRHYETLAHLALLSERLGDKVAAQKFQERARRAAGETGE